MSVESIFKPTGLIELIGQNGNALCFKKDEFIYHSGDETKYIYVVLSGEVFISRMQEEGTELATNMLKKDGIFGSVTLFCGPKTHTTYAKAKTDLKIHRLPRKEFEENVLDRDDLKLEWMRWLEIERMRYVTKMRDTVMYGKLGALCSNLIRLSNSFGETVPDGIRITTKITNQELGLICGTSREVVNRLLSELKSQGIISVDKKIITIHNIDKLRHMINCDNCHIDICQVF